MSESSPLQASRTLLRDTSKQGDNQKPKITTVQVKVFGRVQGVFYRSSLKNEAERLSVTGWTRNLPDGSVEALLQGDEPSVQRMINWCHIGPRNARVDSVTVSSLPSSAAYRNFVILS